MKKCFRILLVLMALVLAFAAVAIVLFEAQDAELADPTSGGVVDIQAASGRQKVPYFTFLEAADLETSTWYSLVDLSDATNFPHVRTKSLVLKQLHYTGVLSEASHLDLKFGVVITMDDEASLVNWFHTSHRIRSTQFDEKWTLPEHGLNLLVNTTAEKLQFVGTGEYTSTAAVTTTTVLTSTGVATTTAAVGDLILYVEVVDVGAGGDFSIGTAYNTE